MQLSKTQWPCAALGNATTLEHPLSRAQKSAHTAREPSAQVWLWGFGLCSPLCCVAHKTSTYIRLSAADCPTDGTPLTASPCRCGVARSTRSLSHNQYSLSLVDSSSMRSRLQRGSSRSHGSCERFGHTRTSSDVSAAMILFVGAWQRSRARLCACARRLPGAGSRT